MPDVKATPACLGSRATTRSRVGRVGLLSRASVLLALVLVTACSGGGTAPPAPAATQQPAPAGTPGAAAPGAPAAAPKSTKDTMVIAVQGNLGTLDPHFAATDQDTIINRNVYDALLKYKPDSSELTGDLATSWEQSPDGLTYTFHLRQDVEWQKGFGHFTANDVKASFDRLKAPETKSPFAGLVSMLKEVQVVDDYTVKMVLSQPYAPFLHLLTPYRAGPIVNVKAIQQFGQDAAWNPVGTGPYEFESGIPNQEATIKAYDKYYGPKPAIARVTVRTVPDLNAQVVGLESHTYDLLEGQPTDPVIVKRLQDEGFTRTVFSRNQPEVLLMDVTFKPFDDVRVRQAIAHAVDREQLIGLAAPDLGKPWYSPVPEGYFAATGDVPRYEHDVAKAKALLAEAGYPNGVDVTMNVYDTQQTAADVLSEQLKQAGIRVTQEKLDQPTFIGRVVQDQGIHFAPHCCVRQPDPDFILSDMFSPKFRGAIYISHADLEAQLAAARSELDVAKRQQLYVDLQKQIMAEALMVPLYMVSSVAGHAPTLQGMPKQESTWGLDLTRLSFQ
jgi:peptide/nickel transport system substrate-binding protein